jgi:hypothetical protein
VKDPLTQECFGEYGYGAGFLFLESQLGHYGAEGENYCIICPLAATCSDQFEHEVELINEGARAQRNAVREHITTMANVIGSVEIPHQPGFEPDPYQIAFVENVARGINDRTELLES